MAYTKFGEFTRIQRVKHHEVMGDLAKVLGVSVSFLSSVENGKKNVPDSWLNILTSHYNLNADETAELKQVIDESKLQMKINLQDASSIQRTMAVQFARTFNDVDEETAKRIIKILGKEKY